MTIDEILAGESKNMEFKIRRPEKSIKYMKSVVAFRVNLYRNQFSINDTKNDTNDTKNDIQSETDAEKQLLKLISRNPEMTQKAMAEQLSFSTITIKRMLTRLQRNVKVKREGSSRRGKWIVL